MSTPEPPDVDPAGIMSLTEYDIAVKRETAKIEKPTVKLTPRQVFICEQYASMKEAGSRCRQLRGLGYGVGITKRKPQITIYPGRTKDLDLIHIPKPIFTPSKRELWWPEVICPTPHPKLAGGRRQSSSKESRSQ